jgi:hypothetical protein
LINNGKKVGYIIVGVVLIAAVTGSFLFGRGSGKRSAGNDTASKIKSLKETIASGLERERELENLNQEIRGHLGDAIDNNRQLTERLEGLEETVTTGFAIVTETVGEQQRFIGELTDAYRTAGTSTEAIEGGLNDSLGLIDSLIEDLSTGHD